MQEQNFKALGEGRICKQTHKGSCKPQSTWWRKSLQADPQRILQTSKHLVKEEFARKTTTDLAKLKGLTEGRICKQNHIEGSSCKAQRIFWRKNLQVKPNWRIFLQSSKDLLKEECARRTSKGCCRKNLQAKTSKGCCRKSLGEKPQSIF